MPLYHRIIIAAGVVLWLCGAMVLWLIRLVIRHELHSLVPGAILLRTALGFARVKRAAANALVLMTMAAHHLFFRRGWPSVTSPEDAALDVLPASLPLLPPPPPLHVPAPSVRAPPGPPPPAMCAYVCLAHTLRLSAPHTVTVGAQTNGTDSLLQFAAAATVNLAEALAVSSLSRLEEALGPSGSFARDAWPLLLLSSSVAAVALVSFASPLLRLIFARTIYPLLDALRRQHAQLQRCGSLATAGVLLLVGSLIADHAYTIHFHLILPSGEQGRSSAYLAVVPYTSLVAICLSLAFALILRRKPEQIMAQLCLEHFAAVAAVTAVALFATASELLCEAEGEHHTSHAATAATAVRGAKAWALRVLRAVPRPLASGSECSPTRCAYVLHVLGGLVMWGAVTLIGASTGSQKVAALARLPILVAGRVAVAGASIADALQRTAVSAGRVLLRRRLTSFGLVSLAAALLLMSCDGDGYASGGCSSLECRAFASRVASQQRWGAWPVSRFMTALWADAKSGSCARGVVRLLLGLLSGSAGIEMIGRDWRVPYLNVLLSWSLDAVRRFVAKPPPPPVKFVRDGVAPLALGATILVQHVANADRRVWCAQWALELGAGLGLMAGGWSVGWGIIRHRPAVVALLSLLRRTGSFIASSCRVLLDKTARMAHLFSDKVRSGISAAGRLAVHAYRVCRLLCARARCAIRAAALGLWRRCLEPLLAALNWAATAAARLVHRLAAAAARLLYRLAVAVQGVSSALWRRATKIALSIGSVLGRALARLSRTAQDIGKLLVRAAARLCAALFRIFQDCVLPRLVIVVEFGFRWCKRASRAILSAVGWLARSARACASRLRCLWREKAVPLARATWRRVIVPSAQAAYRSALLPLMQMFGNRWPVLSAAASLLSCYFFAFGAVDGVRSALQRTSTAGRGALAYDVLLCAVPLLGAVASGSVAILIVGEALGAPRLKAIGARCIDHCDLGLIAACRWARRAIVATSAYAMLCLLRQLSRLTSALRFASRHLARAFRAAARVVGDAVTAVTTTFTRLARALISIVLRVGTALLTHLIVRPVKAIWTSPGAALVASGLLAVAAYVAHSSGARQGLLTAARNLPTAHRAVLASTPHITPLVQAATALGSATAAGRWLATHFSSAGALVYYAATSGGVRVVTAGRVAAAAVSLEAAYASVAALHASPVFSFFVWALLVCIVHLSRPTPVPPRAIAAAQLAIASFCQSTFLFSQWATVLPLLLVLLAAYLVAAAGAARERRQENRRMREAHAAIEAARRDGAGAAASVAAALAAADKPTRVFSAESCAICLEAMEPSGSDDAASTADGHRCEPLTTLRCGHQFHEKCVGQWLVAAASAHCPTCRRPVTLRRSLLEGALFLGDD